MNKTAQYLHFAALLVALCGAAYGINYAYLSDQELTVFGDRIRFWHEDTLSGPVRSNYQIAIMENPVFYDIVIQAGSWTDFAARRRSSERGRSGFPTKPITCTKTPRRSSLPVPASK